MRLSKKFLKALIFLTAAVVIGKVGVSWSDEATPKKVVEAIVLHKKSLRETVRLFGRVRAKLEYTPVAETEGVLDHALLAGQALQKGEVFASLDNPEVKTTYELAQKTEKIALEQYQRSRTLLAKRVVSQKKVETDHAKWLDAKQRSLQAKRAFEQTQFKAPFEGVLGVFQHREGAYLKKGDKIVTLYNPKTLVVEVDIPEKYIRTLSQKSQVLVDGQSYSLTQLQKVVDPMTNMAPSFVELDPRATLIPGSIVDVDLVLEEKQDVLAVPRESLLIEGEGRYVYTIEEDKTVKKEVTLGLVDGDQVEIKTGLQEGDQVVSQNPSRLWPEESVLVASKVETSP